MMMRHGGPVLHHLVGAMVEIVESQVLKLPLVGLETVNCDEDYGSIFPDTETKKIVKLSSRL